ncbi:hypothetical protein [Actinoplanes sichuanensis]|uniref:Uncharacterized protein n=1 Tax=Actinoplanes sichuanensis TaxID=512349 RepID=A0ABW4AT32_9ACTN|nr:hypothetical protein [Actinoplanes sichuanensis]
MHRRLYAGLRTGLLVLGWVVRRRAVLSTTALLTAVALQVLPRYAENGHHLGFRLAVGILPAIPFLLCSAFAARVFHPAKLVARPEASAFDVPVGPSAVLAATGQTFFVFFLLGGPVRAVAADEGLWWLAAILAVLLTGQLAAFWRAALGRFGTRLTPDGIEFRDVFGSLFLPWQALATPRSARPRDAQQVTLHLAHPELVRRRGFRYSGPALLPAAGVDAQLLARAIHEYANDADLRSTIGSTAELDRFLAIPHITDHADRART